MKVAEVMEKVSQHQNTDDTRRVTSMQVGEWVRQGDIYLDRVESIPDEYSIATMELQLAKGDTKGARHILEEKSSLRVFIKNQPSPLDGPAFKSDEEIHVTHPEHGNMVLPAGSYVCTYQQDYRVEYLKAIRD
jgi:hypothetical protein